MKLKTRCIISIVLAVIPILQVLISFISYIPNLRMQTAVFFAQFVSLAFLGEWSIFYYPCYGIVVAVLAYGMYSFSDSAFSNRQERLWLGFPIAAGVFGLLNVLCMLSIGGTAYLPLAVCGAVAFVGWLICNIRLLVCGA